MSRDFTTTSVGTSGASTRAALFLVLFATLFTATMLSGCGRLRRAQYGNVSTVDARHIERLRRVGERDMHCPSASLVIIPMTQNAVELRGCERIREYSLVCRRGRRCNWQPMTPAALLAMRDLSCPLEAMSVAAPSASTRDLIGCGRLGRYAIACVEDSVCRWNLLGPVGPDVAVVPPPAYGTTYGPAPSGGPAAPSATSTGEVPPPPGASVTVGAQVTVSEVPPPPPSSTGPR